MKKITVLRSVAKILLISLSYQLIFPICTYALTTGPSQPEMQSFEPVGTTQMVDMFTGDFNYNIPLLDVEGYPVNIAYHSGINIEQEASWVGLGWNINPGEINRSVRGLPDDFNGEQIEKKLKIKDERTYRFDVGMDFSFEALGYDGKKYGPSIGAGTYLSYNNYRGVSMGFNVKGGMRVPAATAGINIGVGSQTGADVDVSAALNIPFEAPDKVAREAGGGIGIGGSTGFNTRSGLKALNINTSITVPYGKKNEGNEKQRSHTFKGSSSIPVGMQNYVPVITNKSIQTGFSVQIRVGAEAFYTYPNTYLKLTYDELKYETNGTRKGYGYMYSENATEDDILDFSREKDGYYNKTLPNLPLASMTYDVYSVSGHGTGGSFRPFRNDVGTVFDPKVKSSSSNKAFGAEAGLGFAFEGGGDLETYENESESGPWNRLFFNNDKNIGKLNEKLFFKQAGELTYAAQRLDNNLFNNEPQLLEADMYNLSGKNGAASGTLPSGDKMSTPIYRNGNDRTSRANVVSYLTAEEASVVGAAQTVQNKQIHKYNLADPQAITAAFDNPTINGTPRYDNGINKPKAHHISEMTQTLPDGRRYIYGIAAMNNLSQEVTFSPSLSDPRTNITGGIVGTGSGGDDPNNNVSGTDNFYSSTVTPAYAHSYLLTSVLSSDYMDLMGDGPTDDDLGSYTKFHYTKWHDDFRWRAPYKEDEAQFNPGFLSDRKDDRGSYISGSKEVWHLSAIESKNFIAEFYVSERFDGKSAKGKVGSTYPSTTEKNAFKLDSIKLYNKHDRFMNSTRPPAIKTVIFQYDNSLCLGVPNSNLYNVSNPSAANSGKLALKKIYIRYGSSDKNLLSPYKFTYSSANPSYSFLAKDRWGYYKPNNNSLSNHEFPYSNQDLPNQEVTAWNLSQIQLPSGGKINIDYESDDYSFVQNRRAMQMLKIKGVGRTSRPDTKSELYDQNKNANNYIYFRRNVSGENPNLSPKDNYLEGTDILYYSFNLDIGNTGTYEHVKGYAKVEQIDYCNDSIGYIRLRKERAGKGSSLMLHPATIYGINLGRYYLPHVLYPGFNASGPIGVLKGLVSAVGELTSIFDNPFQRFVKDKKGKYINISKSWVRLHIPKLTKKGGGVRVKKLVLNDDWKNVSSDNSNPEAIYGKEYAYTINDSKYGIISSGVASYEPMVGGDENPFKMPVKHTADAGRMLPAIEMFQEEPFGESFFPSPVVGYSSVQVKSIHADIARSAQAEEEHQFYTAKDFPIEIEYTGKKATRPINGRDLRSKYEEMRVLQGYMLKFNDMHGKPRSSGDYLVHVDGAVRKKELVSYIKYNYQTSPNGKLDNKVKALVRKRGESNEYLVDDVVLGEEMDFTVDSRERYFHSSSSSYDLNVNTVAFLFIVVPIPTFFNLESEEKQRFRMMVSTKVIQQYGILKSIEAYDHGAKTVTENLIYDSETGTPLLTRTNNEYNDPLYKVSHPAYLAEEGMGPAYTNIGYEEAVSVKINTDFTATMTTANPSRFSVGDELLLTDRKAANEVYTHKLWIIEKKEVNGNCVYTLAHRYKSEVVGAGSPTHLWTGRSVNNVLGDAVVKVLRSGRRNNLDQYVQQATLTKNPYPGGDNSNISDLFTNTQKNDNAYNSLLNINVRQYTDRAMPFGPPGIDPCVTDQLVVNTGNGSSYYFWKIPGEDPDWKVTSYTDPGLTVPPVTPYNAYIPTHPNLPNYYIGSMPPNPAGSYWFANVSGVDINASRFISFHAGSKYSTPASSSPFGSMKLERQFRTTAGGTLNYDFYVAADDYIQDLKIDNHIIVSNTSSLGNGNYTNFQHYTGSMTLSGAGTHKIEVTVWQKSFPTATQDNWHAFHLKGTIYTSTSTIVDENLCPGYTGSTPNVAPYSETYAANQMEYTDPITSVTKNLLGFNTYVLGHKGNYRVSTEYAHVGNRKYDQNNGRKDGLFQIGSFLWGYNKSTSCLVARKILNGVPVDEKIWNPVFRVTKYDVFGNIVEEKDVTDKYVAAQYDYSKKLPSAVASNVRQRAFCFEGFEEYVMLVPKVLRQGLMNGTSYYSTPFAGPTMATASINKYDQRYYKLGAGLVTQYAHTGKYSAWYQDVSSIRVLIHDAAEEFGVNHSQFPSTLRFSLENGRKYVVNMWLKPANGLSTLPSITKGGNYPFKLLTGNIEGWYLAECVLDLTANTAKSMLLNIPGGFYVDDVRFIPADASMKSFVYDPLTFRVSAQLDENHFATFYEYDQEGQLIRVKKETDRGVMTISETRSSNSKNH